MCVNFKISLMTFVIIIAAASSAHAKTIYKFGGGPAGGTFQFMAGGIATYPPVKAIGEFRVLAGASGGSVENVRKVDSGAFAMGVAYSGHIYLARHGRMKNDNKIYDNVLAVAYFYGAPAQLVVKRGSGIKSVRDLAGKKVGVGNAGSGAFANCDLFFSHMGVWDKIERNAMGYNDAAAAFVNNHLDALWLFTAFPSGAVVMAAQQKDIELIDLDADASASGFYSKYPYFTRLKVPGGTYKGVDDETPTFQDSAIWIANKKVPEHVVYTLLSKIYSPEGLAHMVSVKNTARVMSIENGLKGIVTPLHPGSKRFFAERGGTPSLQVPASTHATTSKHPAVSKYKQRDTAAPIISIASNLSRQPGTNVMEKKITIRGRVEDPSGVVEVLVDGKDAYLDSSGNFHRDIYLSVGENRIQISAMDRFENRSQRTVIISRQVQNMAESAGGKSTAYSATTNLRNWYGKQYSLVVGIDRYENEGIPRLANAVSDAKSIAEMFRKLDFEVIELYNEQATRSMMIKGFSKIKKQAQKKDSFVFYFAGHGQGLRLETGGKVGYIIPYDAQVSLLQTDVINFESQALNLSLLRLYAKDMRAKHIALLLDSCFSGLAMKRGVAVMADGNTSYYNDLLSRKAINILTAGDDQPVSDGSGHSPFTKAILNGIGRGGIDLQDRDGYGTFNQLAVYVKEKVEKATLRRQRPQFDNLSDEDGDLIFKLK